MSKKDEISMGDLVSAIMKPPAPASPLPVEHEAAQSSQQVAPPTPEQLQEMKALGERCGEIVDQLDAVLAPLKANLDELETKKSQLKERMKAHGLHELVVEDRPSITLTNSPKKQPTKGDLETALGKDEAGKLWKKLPTKDSWSLKVPPKPVPEGD